MANVKMEIIKLGVNRLSTLTVLISQCRWAIPSRAELCHFHFLHIATQKFTTSWRQGILFVTNVVSVNITRLRLISRPSLVLRWSTPITWISWQPILLTVSDITLIMHPRRCRLREKKIWCRAWGIGLGSRLRIWHVRQNQRNKVRLHPLEISPFMIGVS